MTNPDLFITIFGAVMFANILTGAFFWGMIRYSQLEKQGTEKTDGAHLPLVAMLMPIAFGGCAIFIALG